MCEARQSKQLWGVGFNPTLDAAPAVILFEQPAQPLRGTRLQARAQQKPRPFLGRGRVSDQPELHLPGQNKTPEDQPTGASAERHEPSRNHSRKGPNRGGRVRALFASTTFRRSQTNPINLAEQSVRAVAASAVFSRVRLTPALTCTGAQGYLDLLAEDRRRQTDVPQARQSKRPRRRPGVRFSGSLASSLPPPASQ